MAIGPGKYDDLCSFVREQVQVEESGGVLLLVIGGNRGGGFSLQCDPTILMVLPEILDNLAAEIRKDLAEGKA